MRKLDIHKVAYLTGFLDCKDFAKNLLYAQDESEKMFKKSVFSVVK